MAGKMSEQFNPYKKPPHNNASNDYHQGYQVARGSGEYSWGKVSPRFSNQSAEIEPHGHNEVTPRKRAHGGGCSCWRCGGRFAKGGAAITPAWKDRPTPMAQRTQKGLKIHAPHSGEGLVMNIHLSPVGAHAISFHSGPEGYSGAVNVARMAARGLASAARPQPFPVMHAPQLGVQAAPGGGFGQAIGQNPANTPGLGAWNLEGVKALNRMP